MLRPAPSYFIYGNKLLYSNKVSNGSIITNHSKYKPRNQARQINFGTENSRQYIYSSPKFVRYCFETSDHYGPLR